MAKKLRLTFTTEGNGTMFFSIEDPQEDLTSETIQAKAAEIIPVLITNAGAAATALKSAVYVNTEETVIYSSSAE